MIHRDRTNLYVRKFRKFFEKMAAYVLKSQFLRFQVVHNDFKFDHQSKIDHFFGKMRKAIIFSSRVGYTPLKNRPKSPTVDVTGAIATNLNQRKHGLSSKKIHSEKNRKNHVTAQFLFYLVSRSGRNSTMRVRPDPKSTKTWIGDRNRGKFQALGA